MVLEEGDFDRWLDYEGGTLMSGISALLKRPKKLPKLCMWGHSEKMM